MKTTISHASQFRDAFRQANRQDQFSYEALNMLYEYFEDVDPDMELDVIAICCEYTEDTFEGIASNYEVDLTGVDEADIPQAVMDFLCDNTSVVGETATGFVYLAF
jgi:hypothetical protein